MTTCIFKLSDYEYAAWLGFCEIHGIPTNCDCPDCHEKSHRVEAKKAPGDSLVICPAVGMVGYENGSWMRA